MSKVIALTNQKGGVGKTTTTLNLGVGLALKGKKVLLIDSDPQGSLTVSLGVPHPDDLEVTLADILRDIVDEKEMPPDYGILHCGEGVDLMPANIELSVFEISLINAMSREYVLKNYLSEVKSNYDYVLIDCMPSLGMLTVNALVAADSVIIPSQANYLSAKGLGLLLKSAGKIKRTLNPNLRVEGIMFTMVDHRTNNDKAVIASMRETGSNLHVFDTEIPFSVRAAETSSRGKSIFTYDGNGKVAKAYEELTKEVLEIERRTKDRSRAEGSVR